MTRQSPKGRPTATLPPMRTQLASLWQHLSRRRRLQTLALLIGMVVGAIAEMATLGAVIPFLSLLSSASTATCTLPAALCSLSLVQASLLFVCVAIGAAAVRLALLWASTRFTFGLGAELGGIIYQRTLQQPYRYHVARNTSETIAGINKINLVVQNVIHPLAQGVAAALLAIGIFAALLWIDARSAVTAMAIFGVLYAGASYLSRQLLRRNSLIIAESEGQRIQAVQEGLGGIRDILIDGTQAVYSARFNKVNGRQRRAQAANNFLKTAPRYVIESAGMVLMVVLALWIHQRDGLAQAIPILGALALGSQKLLPQMQLMYTAWASLNGNRAVLRDVLALLDLQPPTLPAQTAGSDASSGQDHLESSSPLIRLNNTGFHYTAEKPVLKDIQLSVTKGQRVGFIGSTGSGKSTLLDLMMGLIEPTQGSIAVNGRPLGGHNIRQWQSRLAHVPQTIYLSDATIAENIAFGTPRRAIDLHRVREAARRAQLDQFIETLPAGYDTLVGERGVRLSGGQRQRIGLARALYKQADVLVLDEATSALDNETEREVMASLDELGRDITVLVIAHRLSSLAGCDRIVELQAGSIVRSGSYADMIGDRANALKHGKEAHHDH